MLSNHPDVEYVEPNYIYTPTGVGIQEDAPVGLSRIARRSLTKARNYVWDDSHAGEGVDVYVVDTGIRLTHQDFGGRAIFGAWIVL